MSFNGDWRFTVNVLRNANWTMPSGFRLLHSSKCEAPFVFFLSRWLQCDSCLRLGSNPMEGLWLCRGQESAGIQGRLGHYKCHSRIFVKPALCPWWLEETRRQGLVLRGKGKSWSSGPQKPREDVATSAWKDSFKLWNYLFPPALRFYVVGLNALEHIIRKYRGWLKVSVDYSYGEVTPAGFQHVLFLSLCGCTGA